MQLARDTTGEPAQMFPLQVGLTNKTTGTWPNIGIIRCVTAGAFTALGDTITCVAGDTYSFVGPTSVSISSGAFHLAA